MIRNVGTIDRVLRLDAGVALIGLSIMGVIGPWGNLGFVPLLTGLAGNCRAGALWLALNALIACVTRD